MDNNSNKFLKYILDKEYEKRNYKKRTTKKYEEYNKLCIDISYNIIWNDFINDNIDLSFSNIK